MRVLVAAGGSGGHIYPALAVLEELRSSGRLSAAGWVGRPNGMEARILSGYPWVEFFALPSRGLARTRPWTWPGALLQTGLGVVRAVRIVRRFRPDVVLGMGGYPAFAPGVAAKLLGVPVAIHEQNARMGLVNRMLTPLADLVLLSFPVTGGAPRRKRGVFVTGNPVRADIVRPRRVLGDELLVMGGSWGSRGLVDAIVRAAPALAQVPGLRLRVVVGEAAPPEEVAQRLRAAGLGQAEVIRYTDQVGEALSRARLVVARAGATTVAELAAAGCPAVLIPWGAAADGHQHANAHALAEAGGCVLIEDRVLVGLDLGALVSQLWRDEAKLAAMAAGARLAGRPDAAQRVAEALVRLTEARA